MIRPKPKTEAMDFVTSFISIYYLLTIVTLSLGEECQSDSTCACHTSKYKIDLNPLANAGNPRFSSAYGDYLYDYQPCGSLTETCPESGVSVCQKKEGEHKYDAGDANSAKFSGDADAGTLELTYTGAESRTSIVQLKCACGDGEFTAMGENPPTQYNFILKTKYACGSKSPSCGGTPSSGLSTGSILLILFFVFLIVYFVGGILFLKFVRGAQGTELIPNYGFWTALPGLVKDGCLFVFRGCKTDSSYSQI